MKPLLSSCRTDYQKQVDNFPFIGEIAKPTEPATVKMNCTFHEPPLTASTVFADRQSSRSFGRWQISKRKIWTPGCGAGVEPTIYRKKTEGGVTDLCQAGERGQVFEKRPSEGSLDQI